MKIIKAMIVAFSIYSKIPMPRFTWESEDMRYHLCFFPFVGAVIGGLEYLWYYLYTQYPWEKLCFLLVAMAIPLLVTGGFHMDGFMDTMDAIHSYQGREKKLEILKDPHIGAFSVISLVTYLLLLLGFLSVVNQKEAFFVLGLGFALSRVFSGLSVVTMKSAKSDGMLQTFSSTATKHVVIGSLLIEGILVMGSMLWISWYFGTLAIVGTGLTYLYYWWKSKKEFGGITGDLAGFFVTTAELVMVIVVGSCCLFMR